MKNNILKSSIAIIGALTLTPTARFGEGEGENKEAPPEVLPFSFTAAPPIVETITIELKKLVIDAGTQPRVAMDDESVKEYADVIRDAVKNTQPNPFDSLPDEQLPQVFRDPTGRMVLADGFHRYTGHREAKVKEMKVAVRNGTERDAMLFSFTANAQHGVQRTGKDKQRTLKLIFADPEWATASNMDIARHARVSEFMVRDHRPAAKSPSARAVTIRGKKTTMKTGGIGKKGGKAKPAKKGAAGKSAPATPGKGGDAEAAAELDRNLVKIAEAIGGSEGGAFRKAVHDGTLQLSARDVRELASFGKRIKPVAALVSGAARMKPAKAFEFIQSELSEKIISELHNRAIGSLDGTYTFEAAGGLVITAKIKK